MPRRRKRNFNFRWKLAENYTAAFAGLLFLWLFVTGLLENDLMKLIVSIGILAVVPFLVTFIDKKSSN